VSVAVLAATLPVSSVAALAILQRSAWPVGWRRRMPDTLKVQPKYDAGAVLLFLSPPPPPPPFHSLLGARTDL